MTKQSTNLVLKATDPTTAPLQLGRFASSRDANLRHAVANNPNTPSEVLWRLAVRDTGAVLKNQVLDFLILENPNFLAELPAFARSSFLRCKDVPSAWLDWVLAWGDQDSKVQALQNPNLKPEVLESLEQRLKLEHDLSDTTQPGSGEPALLAFLARGHINHPDKLEFFGATLTLQNLLPSLEHDAEHLKDAVALGLVPDWLLEGLSLDDDAQLRLMLAKSSRDQILLGHLCFDEDDEVRLVARTSQQLDQNLIETLERIENLAPLSASEMHLLETGSILALTYLVRNPNIDAAILASFVTHSDWRVRQALAFNLALDAQLLAQLKNDDDKDVRIAVAQHPSSSRAILEFLIGDAAQEVRLAVQANPNTQAAWSALLLKVECQDLSVSLESLRALCERGGWARQLALRHPNLTLEIFEPYLMGDNWHDRFAAAHNPNLSSERLETLALDTDSDVRQVVAKHPNLGFNVLEKLARDEQFEIRKAAAQNPNMIAALLETLASDEHWTVRQAVAQHPATNSSTLKLLLSDSDNDVRMAARAGLHLQEPQDSESTNSENMLEFYRGWFEDHPNIHVKLEFRRFVEEQAALDFSSHPSKTLTLENGETCTLSLLWLDGYHLEIPQDIVSQLARDSEWRIRQEVARYPLASGMTLARLCLDADSDVRTAVAGNPGISKTMTLKLASDENSNVRAAIIRRENLPLEALQLLCCDEELETRALALKHPNLPRNVAERFERLHALDPKLSATQLEELALATPTAHAWVAKHPNVTTKLLEQLGWREHWHLREAAASNPKLERQVLEELAQDTDLDVLRALARNSSTSSEVLLQLVNHSDPSVRRTALENQNLDTKALANLRRACMRQGLRSAYSFNRVLALLSNLVPKLELGKQRHIHAAHPAERIALCLNPNLPDEARETLQHDANILVRSAALEIWEESK